MTILAIKPTEPDTTYYVKLRAKADRNLMGTGKGRLFLGFYPDPVHDAKWNNLVDPMRNVLSLNDGVSTTPAEAVAKKRSGDEEKFPRQFCVDIEGSEPGQEIDLAFHYYGCTPDFCVAMTHDYTISLENEKRCSRTFGMNPRPHRGGPGVGLGGRPRDQPGGGPRGPDGGGQPKADR